MDSNAAWQTAQHMLATFAVQADQPAQRWALLAGALGAGLVVVSAFVRTMIPLRWLAVGSNAGFIVYGLLHANGLLVALHVVLLPVNLWRVWQMVVLTRRANASGLDPQQLQVWLRPYMRSQRLKDGAVIFAAGDRADRLYLLVEGQVELPEVRRYLGQGQMFGEIAFFAPEHRRTSSAVCRGDCTVMSIDEDTFRQLVHQSPEFGLQVLTLVAGRLSGDIQRLQRLSIGTSKPGAGAPPPGEAS